jgi:hypothetical protein
LRRLRDKLADALREWLHKKEDEQYLMLRGLLAEVQNNWEKLKPDLSSQANNFYQRSLAYEEELSAERQVALRVRMKTFCSPKQQLSRKYFLPNPSQLRLWQYKL